MMPKIIGIKSPILLIEGVNNIGKANKTKTIAVIVVTLIIFGRAMDAILISSNCFYWV
jgi:hypothetical protein